MNNLHKRLIINALENLNNRLGNESCNDLFLGDELLINISKSEFNDISREWAKLFPKEALEHDNEMNFDTQLIDFLIEKIKQENE